LSALYLISPPRIGDDFPALLAAALDAAPVAAFQLRLKHTPPDSIRRTIETLLPITQSRDVAFILNDDADLAIQTGCDGAHLGQDDLPKAGIKSARTRLGSLSLGITCHASRHLAMEAAEAGADYVAFGAVFPTTTKDPKAHAEIDLIAWWASVMEIPCVAIGGIDATNCAPLVTAGADFLAVIGAVWHHEAGPAAGITALHRAIQAAEPAPTA
jgi:thiamine-phosphate pyrophosphorylase